MKRGPFVVCQIAVLALGCRPEAPESAAPESDGSELYAQVSQPTQCVRPVRTAQSGKEIIVRSPPDDYPCRLVFRETGIVLRGDSAGRWPDPGQNVARDSQGRWFTSIVQRHEVAVWNPDGTFGQIFGRAGQGPGEFPSLMSEPIVVTDAADRIYVRHFDQSWRIFEPDLTFATQVSLKGTGNAFNVNAVTGDGCIVSSAVSLPASAIFQVVLPSDTSVHAFGPIPEAAGSDSNPRVARAIAATRDSTFWAAPFATVDHRYVLEQWSAGGTLLRTLIRDASWYRDLSSGAAPRPPPPSIQPRNVDQNGNLLVLSWIANEHWSEPVASGQSAGPPLSRWNIHLEVIDPDAGAVLASEVVSLQAIGARRGRIPRYYIAGTSLGYYVERSDLGLSSIHLVEYQLVGRNQTASR